MLYEKSFIVMDQDGNYYKDDPEKQLVVAEKEEEATVYFYSDAVNRIRGRAGEDIRFLIIPADVGYDEELDKHRELPSAIREVTEEELLHSGMEIVEDNPLSQMDWADCLKKIYNIMSRIGKYKRQLRLGMGTVDKKICDILHYIELCKVDDSETKDLVELLRICREKRRTYKDEIFRASMVKKCLGGEEALEGIINAIGSIEGLENRKYKPREYSRIFEGEETVGATNNNEIQNYEESVETIEPKCISLSKEGFQMERTKKATPFDDKNIDWLKFARKQAEFYKNARQYIMNNEIEMSEIDAAISDVMKEIEVSNCNVTQGYKLFKRLKDLRLERKEKETELNALYILTGSFDLTAMEAISRRNVSDIEMLFNDSVIEFGSDKTESEDTSVNIAG